MFAQRLRLDAVPRKAAAGGLAMGDQTECLDPFFILFFLLDIRVAEKLVAPYVRRGALPPEGIVVTDDADLRLIILYVIGALFAAELRNEPRERFAVCVDLCSQTRRMLPHKRGPPPLSRRT